MDDINTPPGDTAKPYVAPIIKKQLTSNTPDFDDVALGGISLRGLITFILIGSLVALTGFGVVKPDVLVALASASFGFYFNNNKK